MTDERPPRIGAFEADAWAGLVVATGDGRGAAIRVAVELPADGGTALDGPLVRVPAADLFLLTHEVGPCAPEGTYARVAFDLRGPLPPSKDAPVREVAGGEASLVWEWARRGQTAAVARATAGRPLRLVVEGACPWDWTAAWRVTPRGLAARLPDVGSGPATWVCLTVLGVQAIEPAEVEGGGSASLVVTLGAGESVALDLQLGHGFADVPPAASVPTASAADQHLALAAEAYAARRVVVTGAQEGLAASVTNNLHWMVLLQPERHRRYVPAGRRWIFPREAGGRDDWTIFEWDGFFNALLASLEDETLAREMLSAVLETQYPDGNIPNWRSRTSGTPDRSQPPVGAYVVLKLVLRTGDLSIATETLPALERWHAWWSGGEGRPGRRRPTGLYAWGSDVAAVPAWVPSWEREASHRQKAAWESGQDDLPNWDDVPWDDARSTLAMDCVDLSALVALDAYALMALYAAVHDAAGAERYGRESAGLCRLIDERLWDDARGIYADRFDDGRFSSRVAASNFLPLLAGAGTGTHVQRALETLRDPGAFWGDWIVPTISRTDPAFPDQQYWRGTIWPPTNFLLYEGLRRVGAEDLASALAARSVALFLGDWRAHQLCRENFSSLDGAGGGQRHQSWGPLFAWTGLAEFVDASPWDGLRVGALAAGPASTARRLRVGGVRWDITLGPGTIMVMADGRRLFGADGPVALRRLRAIDGGWQAEARVARHVRAVDGAGTVWQLVPGAETPLQMMFGAS